MENNNWFSNDSYISKFSLLMDLLWFNALGSVPAKVSSILRALKHI